MLNSLRQFAGNLAAKILLVLLILSFAIWGVGDMVGRPSQSQDVATVGNVHITATAFGREYQRTVENARRVMGENFSPELLKLMNLPQQTLQKIINRNLLILESTELGLVPGDADIARLIRNNTTFHDEKGNFSKDLFLSALRQNNLSEQTYIQLLRNDQASKLLLDMVGHVDAVPNAAVHTLYEIAEEQRIAIIYTLNPSTVKTIALPDSEVLEAYYSQNNGKYNAPELRDLSYLSFKAEDLQKDIKISEDAIKKAYEERLEEFKRPERRVVEQLLFGSEDKAKKAHEMLASGKPFGQLAKSADIMNKGATSLGPVTRETVLDAAADAIFTLQKNGFTEPVQSPFGWHIFHVSDIKEPSVTPLEEVRSNLEKELKQHAGDDALNHFANKLEDALAGGSTLAEAAQQFELAVHKVASVDANGKTADGTPSKDVPDYDKFLQVAFKLEEKTESSLTSTKSGIYYIVRTDSITPERTRALDEVRGLVTADWQKEEREKQLGIIAKEISEAFAENNSRGSIIAKYRLASSSTGAIKRTPDKKAKEPLPDGLVSDLFTRTIGNSTDAYRSENGDYLIAVVKDIIPAKASKEETTTHHSIRQQLIGDMQNELIEQYLGYLATKHHVTTNEAVLESITNAAP